VDYSGLLSAIGLGTPQDAAITAASMSPAGPFVSGGLALNDIRKGDYGTALLDGLGVLPFVPALGGIVRGAKGSEMFNARAIIEHLVSKGMDRAKAERHAFSKTGVDVNAPNDFNIDTTPGGYLGGFKQGEDISKRVGMDTLVHIIGEPTAVINRRLGVLKGRKTPHAAVIDDKTLGIHTKTLRSKKRTKQTVTHESQHIFDNKNATGFLKNKTKKFRADVSKLNKVGTALIKKRDIASGAERIHFNKKLAVLQARKDRLYFRAEHEVRARAAGSHSHLPLTKRPTISERLAKESSRKSENVFMSGHKKFIKRIASQ